MNTMCMGPHSTTDATEKSTSQLNCFDAPPADGEEGALFSLTFAFF